MAFFDITLQTNALLGPFDEPDDFISEYTGVIRKHAQEGDKVTPIGKARAYRIHVGQAANHGFSLYDVCDCHSEELHSLQKTLYEPGTYDFKEPIIQKFETIESDCLVLDYIVLNPKWRGLKLGLLAARKMIDLLGDGCGLVVSEILPLSPDAPRMMGFPPSWVPIPELDEERAMAKKKLRGYFRKMGFQRIGKTAFFGLSMARLTATAEEILKPGEP